MRSSVLQFIAATSFALFAAAPSWADNPGHHPAYLHALSDLRNARAHLEHVSSDPVDRAEEHAIADIDKAINEIKKAAIMDGKNVSDHMPVDPHLGRRERFLKAMEMLDFARKDVAQEEDQPDTRGLQMRTLHHIDEARRATEDAIHIVFGPH